MEEITDTHATIRHLLGITEMFKVRRLHLQKEETKGR